MNREIITTADGSHTVGIPELKVTYHSHHGALQESLHVFLEAGLHYLTNSRPEPQSGIRIFEMGFGTGLNALLTAVEAQKLQVPVSYTAVEQYPLRPEEANSLNYADLLQQPELFRLLHQCAWEEKVVIHSCFTLQKIKASLHDFLHQPLKTSTEPFHLVYYDAFAPSAQPDLWSEEVFRSLHSLMLPGGVLVTYCSKGSVRRALQAAGFFVTKLPGPPGKREMVRAEKPVGGI